MFSDRDQEGISQSWQDQHIFPAKVLLSETLLIAKDELLNDSNGNPNVVMMKEREPDQSGILNSDLYPRVGKVNSQFDSRKMSCLMEEMAASNQPLAHCVPTGSDSCFYCVQEALLKKIWRKGESHSSVHSQLQFLTFAGKLGAIGETARANLFVYS